MSVIYLIVDALCLLAAAIPNFRHLGMLHPLAAYLFFHVYCFSMRAWEIYLGAPTMYSVGYSSRYEPATISEIQRGILLADVALIIFAMGCLFARSYVNTAVYAGRMSPWKPLDRQITLSILYVTMLVGGLFFFVIRVRQANLDFGAFSTYAGVATMWPITGLIGLYFIFGRFWAIAFPAFAYLLFVALQGYHRFMFVLPVIALIGVYLFHHRKKWPPLAIWVGIGAILLVFPSLKSIGRSVGEGNYQLAREQIVSAFSVQESSEIADSGDGFLDQFACYLTLCDQYGKFEYGKTYFNILTLPIPRAWWPEKPGLGDHIIERATPSRPYDREGRIITYLGQAYVNFWLIGILIVPFLLAFMLTTLYERFTRLPGSSLAALIYIFIASTFIQAYRDGLTSVILFGLVFNMPLIFIWFSHATLPTLPFAANMNKSMR